VPELEELKFVRIVVPELLGVIPRYLFEQIKELDDEAIDTIRANAGLIMTVPIMAENGQVIGRLPTTNVWIALLYDTDNGIKGFLWAEFDIIGKRIFVQACSVDKEYQSTNGEFISKVVKYLRGLPVPDDMKNNIQLATITPKAFERRGWKRTKLIQMELHDESEKTDEQSVPDGDVGGGGKPAGSKA